MNNCEIIFFRHAHARLAIDYGDITSEGAEQARLLGMWLQECGASADLIVLGGRDRHAITAEIIVKAVGVIAPIQVDSTFDEVDYKNILLAYRPEFEDRTCLQQELANSSDPNSALMQIFAAASEMWVSGHLHRPGLCSWKEFQENVSSGLFRLARTNASKIWVFTSSGAIASLIGSILCLDPKYIVSLAYNIRNTSMTSIRTFGDKAHLINFNCTPHLDRQL